MTEGEKFARKCSVTGEGMNEGHVFRDGEMYFSTDELAQTHMQILGCKSVKEAYKAGEIYYTDWYGEENSWEYIVKNGELVEIE
jgi:hypothetical protein